ncbi:MAG: peptide/nickel transport system substrate-binding protein [Chloroflexota bacterium]|jgi:peptide/nickel transport system substrate-binding protein|nr:peptide/nickel transport system substrate-binding protein [Chloroflexota bacterium]
MTTVPAGRISRILVALVMLLTAACASPGPAGPGPEAPSAPAAPAAPRTLILGQQAGEEPKDGGIPYGGGAGSSQTAYMLHAGLVVYDENGSLQPWAAQRVPTIENGDWKINPDNTMEVTWRLRPDAMWHDGTPFSADDVILGFKVGPDPELFARGTGVINQISEMTAPDPKTLVIRWKTPYIFANAMALDTVVPLPSHLLGPLYESGNKQALVSSSYLTDDWVGLGPYRLKEWVRGGFIDVVANDQYFLGRPKVDQMTVRFVGDTSALVLRAVGGDVDVIPVGSLKLAEANSLKTQWEAIGAGTVIPSPSRLRAGRWQFRDASAPWAGDPRVRQALVQLIDRQGIVETIFGGLASVVDVLLPQEDAALTLARQRGLPGLAYNPTEAHRLLAAAGLSRGTDGAYRTASGGPFPIEIQAQSDINSNVQVLQAMANDWKTAGIDATTFAIPGSIDWHESGARVSGVYIGGSTPGYDAYNAFVTSQLSAESNRWRGSNMGGYSNAAFDQLVARVFNTTGSSERDQLAAEMAKTSLDQMLYLPLHSDDDTAAVRSGVRGVTKVTPKQRISTWNVHQWSRE